MRNKPAQKPSVGDLVIITFLDHAENAHDALLFEVVGRIFDITKRAYKIRCWGYISDVDRAGDGRDDNETSYAIVKSTIESIKVLKSA